MKIFKDKSVWDGEERRSKERIRRMRMMLRGKKLKLNFSNFRKRLLIYFFLVIFAALTVSLEMIFEIGSNRTLCRISNSVTSQLTDAQADRFEIDKVAHVLKQLQIRMILVTCLVLILMIAAMIVFIRNIVEPLDTMAKSARKIASGQLNETVPIRYDDEIGKIGQLLNELSVNLQEILLHLWNSTGQNIALLNNMYSIICSQADSCKSRQLEEDIECVRQDMETLQEMVKTFDFYNVELSDGRLLAAENTDEENA